jgi:peptidoglycan-N-acetylglucosamine deacetylase
MIFRTPFILPLLYPTLIWKIPTGAKEIFLTFDDGPVPGPTEFVLDTLRQENCKGSFFTIGDNVEKHPDIYQRILKEGHVVGNHTFNHVKGWSHSDEDYISNIKKCDHAFGYKSQLFRPPYGRIKKSQISKLTDYKIVMWDVLTYDYNHQLSPERCLKSSIRATRPGSVVVFHDSVKAEKNMRYALPRFIDHFLNQGFVFKPIPLP